MQLLIDRQLVGKSAMLTYYKTIKKSQPSAASAKPPTPSAETTTAAERGSRADAAG